MRAVDIAVRERLTNLYRKYPDHESWVKGTLVRALVEKGEHSIFVYNKVFFQKEYNKEMPISDDNGVVEIEDLIEMLRLEGFKVEKRQEYNMELVSLEVSLCGNG